MTKEEKKVRDEIIGKVFVLLVKHGKDIDFTVRDFRNALKEIQSDYTTHPYGSEWIYRAIQFHDRIEVILMSGLRRGFLSLKHERAKSQYRYKWSIKYDR